jgi:hypothetical protein
VAEEVAGDEETDDPGLDDDHVKGAGEGGDLEWVGEAVKWEGSGDVEGTVVDWIGREGGWRRGIAGLGRDGLGL